MEIFSLSAIDLFASALGAFVIITAILIPYYPNMKDGGKTLERMITEIQVNADLKADAEAKAESIEEAIKKKIADSDTAEKAQAIKEALKKKASAMTASSDQLSKELASLRDELYRLKKLNKNKPKPAASDGLTDFSVLGITTKAKKILIVVDLSGSMNSWSEILVNTLLEIVEPLHEEIQFGIIGYQGVGVTQFWPVRGKMAVADARSKADARRFINEIPGIVDGSTPTQSALLQALNDKPEAIILVSDGEPSDEEGPNIVRHITNLNNRRIEINTVAVGDYLSHSQLVTFLNDLAKKNKGQFVGVMND